MDNLILRFPHVVEQIFEQLDDKSLVKCREVEKSWKKFIDERNYPWIRIVKIPTVLRYGCTYLHLATQTGQTKIFRFIIGEEDDKNPQDDSGQTPFHLCCNYGHSGIADIIMKESTKSNIDLNAKDIIKGWTAFHLACNQGQAHIVKMLLKNSSQMKIDLNVRNNDGRTAFHCACVSRQSEIAEILLKNSVDLKIELTAEAFLTACLHVSGLKSLFLFCLSFLFLPILCILPVFCCHLPIFDNCFARRSF